MQTKFIIFTMGRTGSSWLCDLLNSHSEIDCQYELFKNDQTSPLEKIDSLWRNSRSQVCGFKILENQLDYEMHKQLASSSEYKKILLIRKNPLERYLSLKLAQLTGVWHLDHQLSPDVVERGLKDILLFKYSLREIKDKFLETIRKLIERYKYHPETITLAKDELIHNIKLEQDYNQMIKNSFRDDYFKIIYYEDLCENKNEVIKDLSHFLGVHVEELISSRAKIDNDPLHFRIQNYHELKEQLTGTEFAQYL